VGESEGVGRYQKMKSRRERHLSVHDSRKGCPATPSPVVAIHHGCFMRFGVSLSSHWYDSMGQERTGVEQG
jgi:hypothetical protein